MDNSPKAIVQDQKMTSSPITNKSNVVKLTMANSELSESMPGDEEEQMTTHFQPHPPDEQSLRPAPEDPPSSPTSMGSVIMLGMKSTGKDDVDLSNNSNNNNNAKDGIVKPKTQDHKTMPDMNPRYKDVQETGQWGDLSSREFYIAIAAFLLLIIAVVLAVVFLVILPGNGDGNEVIVPAPTNPPSMPPTKIPPQEELALVLAAIEKSPFTASLVEDDAQMPNDPTFYKGLLDDDSSTPPQKAIDWLLFQDDFKDSEQSVVRFALVSFYFQMGGPNWVSSEGWLTSEHLCEWEHISCDARKVLQELDLGEQNMTGTLPMDIALLGGTAIRSIILSRNNISGPIPGGVLASLPSLGILYLNNNAFTGTIPVELIADARLRKWPSD
jgi:hypothetical protein